MIDAFVIAFIHCAAQGCVISYPRPGQIYSSYKECEAQLPAENRARQFDPQQSEGAETTCMEVPAEIPGDEWVVLETSNLRQGPSIDAEVIGTVKRGTPFRVFGHERKWLDIETVDGAIGFLWADRAQRMKSSSSHPLPANHAALD